MSALEGLAAAVAAAVAGLFLLWRVRRGGAAGAANRWTRLVLWMAIASPLLVLLVPPEDRPRVFVSGPGGAFEALRLLSFSGAAAAAVASLPLGPRRAWSAALLVVGASVAALTVSVLRIR